MGCIVGNAFREPEPLRVLIHVVKNTLDRGILPRSNPRWPPWEGISPYGRYY
jgi:hypothetical protein